MLLIGVRKSRAHVDVSDDAVEIHFGRTYRYTLDNILSVEPKAWRTIYGYGIRYVPGNIVGFVASSKGVVVMHLKEEREVKVGPLKLEAKAIAVSLEDADGFLKTLGAPTS